MKISVHWGGRICMITITYESLTDFQVLCKVYEQCRKKKWPTYAQNRFGRNMAWELIKLQNSFIENTYIMSKGRKFLITEPKGRWITVSPFTDKNMQKLLYTTVFQPYLETHSIYNSVACQKGNGVSFAYRDSQSTCVMKQDNTHPYYMKNYTSAGRR